MLDFIGTIVLTAAIIVSVEAILGALPLGRAQRISFTLAIGLWTGLAAALAGAGLFKGSNPIGPPVIGSVIVFPLIAAALAATVSPAVRRTLLALPLPLLVGLNVWRVGGGFFLLLAAQGRLGGPFPQSAGWGDVMTGVLALPVAWVALRRASAPIVWAWNAFGLADLTAAIALASCRRTARRCNSFMQARARQPFRCCPGR